MLDFIVATKYLRFSDEIIWSTENGRNILLILHCSPVQVAFCNGKIKFLLCVFYFKILILDHSTVCVAVKNHNDKEN